MMNLIRLMMLIALAGLLPGGCGQEHSPDDGHDHSASADAVEDEHGDAEDEHGEHDENDHGEDDADRVELTPDQREHIDLEMATASPGTIAVTAAFPGEVILNPDRRAHIVPRAAGIVREVNKGLGDSVEEGEILAWIESDELAEAKLAFYAARAEVGCCQMELPRAKEIFENTNRLLKLLEQEPSAEELEKLDGFEMGDHRGRLVAAWSTYLATRKAHERERDLFAKQVSSRTELIEAEAAFKKAQAEFAAARDVARYQVLVDYSEAARRRQVAEFEAVAAEQRLRLKGVGDDVLSKLLAMIPQTAGLEPCLCDDPNCRDGEIPSVLETLGAEERLGWYALRAPFAGFITEKHLTLGEKVDDESSVMTIADTSSVWVRFNVYQKDLALVKAGQEVRIELGEGAPTARGTITYVAPIIERQTRTAPARVELANPRGAIRPGLYAMVHVDLEPVEAEVVVRRDAVQMLNEAEVVFAEDGDGFVPVAVRLGRSDRQHIAVLAGLEPGRRYVERGAFEMKAKLVTRGAGAHAGHGH